MPALTAHPPLLLPPSPASQRSKQQQLSQNGSMASLFRTHALYAHSQLTHRFCCRPLRPHNVASSSSIHEAAAWHHHSEHMHCTQTHSPPTASAAALSSLTTCGESTLAKLVPPALLLRSSMLPAPHTTHCEQSDRCWS